MPFISLKYNSILKHVDISNMGKEKKNMKRKIKEKKINKVICMQL